MIRNAKVDVSERDNIVAAKLLSDLGEIEDPTEELIQFIAKLSCYTSEHFVTSEAKSLDEELQEEEQEEKPKRKSKDSRNKREDGDRQESKRGREKGRERDNDKDRGRARDRDRDDSSRDRKDSSRKSDQEPRKEREVQPEEFRLYLGQGTSHNLNEDSFKKLAQEKADVDAKDLKKLTIREHYGFVDALEPVAKKLIENLNGIEINGSILPVEKATSLTEKPRKRRPQSRDRGRSRGRKDSNKRSSGDRRRN
jgi:RNA recognition motif-containing protein